MCNQASHQFCKLYWDRPAEKEEQAADNLSDDDSDKLTDERAQRYRQQAKRYKKKCQALKESIGKQAMELRRQHEASEVLQQQSERAKAAHDCAKDDLNTYLRALEQANLQRVQWQRRHDTLHAERERMESLLLERQDELELAQKNYDKNLRRASAQSLLEVQHIIDAYPKVTRENQQLKAKLFSSQQQQSRPSTAAIAKSAKSRHQLLKDMGVRGAGENRQSLAMEKKRKLPNDQLEKPQRANFGRTQAVGSSRKLSAMEALEQEPAQRKPVPRPVIQMQSEKPARANFGRTQVAGPSRKLSATEALDQEPEPFLRLQMPEAAAKKRRIVSNEAALQSFSKMSKARRKRPSLQTSKHHHFFAPQRH
jgi:hypothetical protein